MRTDAHLQAKMRKEEALYEVCMRLVRVTGRGKSPPTLFWFMIEWETIGHRGLYT